MAKGRLSLGRCLVISLAMITEVSSFVTNHQAPKFAHSIPPSSTYHGNIVNNLVSSVIHSPEDIEVTEEKNSLLPRLTQPHRPEFENGLRYKSDDWFKNFISLFRSFILRRIKFHLFSNIALCGLVVAANRANLLNGALSIPPIGHTMLGSFLGLLLVFRTNSAYARFYESRGVWSKTKTLCRNIAMAAAVNVSHHSPKSSKKLMELIKAFPDALAHRCLPGINPVPDNVEELVGGAITPNREVSNGEKQRAVEADIALCMQMHEQVYKAAVESPTAKSDQVEAAHLAEISHNIEGLVSAISGCEKIVTTPVPLSYSRHTSRFLTIWCGTLPLALVKQLGLLTLPVVAITCWCLFGIEEIGHLIEQPFTPCLPRGADQSVINKLPPLLRKAALTKAYDIGLPVNTIAMQIREEVKDIEAAATRLG